MKILLGIGHPADAHFFRWFIAEMKSRGHEVFVVAREKESTCLLLDKFKIPYHRISSHQKTVFFKGHRLFYQMAADVQGVPADPAGYCLGSRGFLSAPGWKIVGISGHRDYGHRTGGP